ncbi:GPO family capsid scaffolding protein [Klebsiella pneumoniae]
MAKKVSKWFRIGVEGDTCDGRVISATDIQEMAETFDPRVYGCRINLEHLKGICRMARSAVTAMWLS